MIDSLAAGPCVTAPYNTSTVQSDVRSCAAILPLKATGCHRVCLEDLASQTIPVWEAGEMAAF